MIRALAFAAVLAVAPAAWAASPQVWTVIPAKSSVAFSGTAPAGAFTGAFGKWTASIVFSPDQLAASKAVVSINVDSAKIPDPTGTAALKTPDWFSVKAFPTASYATSAIKSLGGDKYQADGVLTIRGKSAPVTLPFTLTIAGDTATMNGAASLDRLAFDLGKAYGPDMVSRTITLKISVSAHK